MWYKFFPLLCLSLAETPQSVPLLYVSQDLLLEAPKTRSEKISALGDESFYLASTKGEGRLIPASCDAIDMAVDQGLYAGDTAQAGTWAWARVLCNHAKIVHRLRPAKVSYLADEGFSAFEFFSALLPLGIKKRLSQASGAKCDEGGYSYCITINEIDEETGYNTGQTFTFTLQYAGDLNDDGVQDYVVFLRQQNFGGNGFWSVQLAATRKTVTHKVEILSLDWVKLAGGGN